MDIESRADVDWAAVEARWQLEPELKRAPPRRVRARGESTGCGAMIRNAFLGCALTGVFALGLMLSLWAAFAVLILPFGSTTSGTITQHEITSGSNPRYGSRGGGNYFLHFEFSPPGNAQIYRGEWPVDGDTFLKLRDGEAASVRYFALAPGLRPTLEAGTSPWFHVLFLGPLGLLLLVVGGLPLLSFLPRSRKGKKLVARGLPVAGLVMATQNNRAEFWFRVTNARGQTRVIEAHQRLPTAHSTRAGDVVTVLFDKRRPQRALIYATGEWRARVRAA